MSQMIMDQPITNAYKHRQVLKHQHTYTQASTQILADTNTGKYSNTSTHTHRQVLKY